MTRSRRLRRLVVDAALLERFASGESSRSLARDYGVAHTTVLRCLRRPEVAAQLRKVRERLRVERKARSEARAEERQLELDLPRRAREAARRDRELAAWRSRPTQFPNSEYAEWIDERGGPRGLSSKERMNRHNELAEQVVTAGGGVKEVIEATGLRTKLNVYRLIDSRVVQRARANDRRREQRERLAAVRLRRLTPDSNLFARRATGEPLRRVAADYGVSHTTLLHYLNRPEVAQELRSHQRELEKQRRRWSKSAGKDSKRGEGFTLAELAAQISAIRCPRHPAWMQVSTQDEPGREPQLVVAYCCWEAELELLRRLEIDHNLRPGKVVTVLKRQT